MFDVGISEIMVIAVVALIVLGPEKLPGAARTAGALLRRVRSGWDNVRAEVERELEIEQIKRSAREAAARAEAAQNEMKEGLQQVREPLEQAAAEAMTMTDPESARTAESTDPAVVCDDPADTMQAELPLGEPPALAGSIGKPSHDDT